MAALTPPRLMPKDKARKISNDRDYRLMIVALSLEYVSAYFEDQETR